MSDTPARDVFAALVAEQRIGVLNVQLGKKNYRLQILPDEIGLLDWGGLRQLKITDVLTYEGVASEEDFLHAQQESKQKRKPIEQVLQQLGLLEAELLPAIEARLVIEAVHGLLSEGVAGEFVENDGTPPSEPEAVVEVADLLEFMTRVEEDLEVFAGHAELTSIIGLTTEVSAIKAQPEIIGYSSTLARLINGCRTVETLVKESRLPVHHVLRTLNSFFDAGVAKKFTFGDLQQQAAAAEEKGQYDQAFDLYQAAHQLRPGDLEVLEKLAMIAELVENKHGIADANDQLAQLHVAARNEPGAVKCYERVIRFDPHHQAAHEYLFKHSVRQELHGEMIRIGRELIRIHFERGEYDQAKQVANRCLTVAPGDLRLLDALAKTHVTCGESEAAVAVYERVMEQYEKKGEKQEAMNLLMILRRLAPEREDFQRKIESAHSAEKRKTIVKWTVVAMAPVLLILLVMFLLHRASAARALAAHEAILETYEAVVNSERLDALETLRQSMTKFTLDYPGDTEVQVKLAQINREIVRLEQKRATELQEASSEAKRLLNEALEAQTARVPDFERASSLFDQALEVAPVSNTELRNEIAVALAELRSAIASADNEKGKRLQAEILETLKESDLRTARLLMDELEEVGRRSESARDAHRELSDIMQRSESTIVGASMAKARDRQAGGYLEEARDLFERIKIDIVDPKVQAECDERLRKIKADLKDAAGMLEAGEVAIQSRENALATNVLHQLYKNYGNTKIAEEIRLPVEVNSNLDRVDITGADGAVRRNVPLPYTVRLGMEDSMIIELSRVGFDAESIELKPNFESHVRYVELKRAPIWVYEIDGSLAQRPIPHGDMVVLASSKSSLHLVDLKEGNLMWDAPYPLGGITGFGCEPIVVGQTILVPTTARKVVGVSLATGKPLWELPGGKAFRGAPAVDADGKTVYVGCDDGLVYAIDAASGRELRTGKVGAPICGKILYHSGRIYFGAEDDSLHALDANTLQEAWSVKTGSDILTRPVLSGDRLLFVSRDTSVYAVKLDGTQEWAQSVKQAVIGDIGLAPNGTLYVATVGVDGTVHGLSVDKGEGGPVTPVTGPIPGGVAVAGDRLYYGSEDSFIRCFKLTIPVELRWELKVGGRITTAPSISSDMLIIGTAGNRVYAFERE